MNRRQTNVPRQWLIADERTGDGLIDAVRRLPRGAGILLLHRRMRPGERQRLSRKLARLARSRGLMLVDEAEGVAVRVHNARELARARLGGARLILLSPVFPTRSHPDWRPIPRMRAAALARLAGTKVIALGGMDAERFAQVKALGFHGWAGIDAWLKKER